MRRLTRAPSAAALPLLFSISLLGQAWVAPKGEGAVTLAYQNVVFRGHFDAAGDKNKRNASHGQNVLAGFEYSLTDKAAFSVSLPYVASKKTGTTPSSDELRLLFDLNLRLSKPSRNYKFLDDGSYHSAFQDFRCEFRYNLLARPVVLTPFVGAVIPSHHYQIIGEAAEGRDLRELPIGINVGRLLEPWLPKTYVHGRYSYAFVQKPLGVPLNRSNVDLEAGFLASPRLSLRALGAWQHTHGGLLFPVDLITPELFLTHDRLLRTNYWHVGGGVTVSVRPTVDISANVITFLAGSSTHFGTGGSVAVSRRFGGGSRRREAPDPDVKSANPPQTR